jgi:alkanesulfonate monooxygenase SsuD/methylene tetrahydromethanopterin reductase-like flavin-dependent oxidoreductase (luciferase family)
MNPRDAHPVFGPNRFKLGLFNANVDGGLSLSKAPERWRAEWPAIEEVSVAADRAGIDFILPAAKWKGFGGEADSCGRSFETLTHGAAIGAMTRRIGIFCTVHVPLVTPVFAAKAIATIDHITRGRVGLNIVCGWHQDEFNMHGVTIDADRRYDQGLEWFRIFAKLLEDGKTAFDWDGEFYRLSGLTTDPDTKQRPWPVIMSAGVSSKGRAFAGQACDVLFTALTEIDRAPGVVADAMASAAAFGRCVDVYTLAHIVCRPTRGDADAYYHYFAEEMADRDAVAYYRGARGIADKSDARFIERPIASRFSRSTGLSYAGSYPGAFPIVGSPDDIVDDMRRLSEAGLAGASVSFLDYTAEFSFFVAEVVPRLERAGLRVPMHAPAVSGAAR